MYYSPQPDCGEDDDMLDGPEFDPYFMAEAIECSPTELDSPQACEVSEMPETQKVPDVPTDPMHPTIEIAEPQLEQVHHITPPSPKAAEVPNAPVPVATPCRATAGAAMSETPKTNGSHSVESTPASHLGAPDLGDETQETPIPGELRLSQNAINLRMHRVMKVDSKGGSKVSEEIRNQFHSKKGKLRLQQLFQTVGFDSDRLAKQILFLSFHVLPPAWWKYSP